VVAAIVLQRVALSTASRLPPWRTLSVVTLASTAIGYLLPGGPGLAGIYAARRYRDSQVEQEVAAGSQLLVGLLSGVALGCIGLAGIALSSPADFPGTLDQDTWTLAGVLAGLCAACCALGLTLLGLARSRRWLHESRLVCWVVGSAPTPDRPVRHIAVDRRHLALGLPLALLVLLADLSCLVACLATFGVRVTAPSLILGYAIVTLAGMLPVTPGGLGVVEGGLAALLVVSGPTAWLVGAAILGYRLISYWLLALVGGIALLAERARHARRYADTDEFAANGTAQRRRTYSSEQGADDLAPSPVAQPGRLR
jgi:uncharacterized membrane protein YbhN (UPF0104 family)